MKYLSFLFLVVFSICSVFFVSYSFGAEEEINLDSALDSVNSAGANSEAVKAYIKKEILQSDEEHFRGKNLFVKVRTIGKDEFGEMYLILVSFKTPNHMMCGPSEFIFKAEAIIKVLKGDRAVVEMKLQDKSPKQGDC